MNSQATFYSLEETCEYPEINSESFFEDSFNLRLNAKLPDLNTVDNIIDFISNSSIDSTIHLNENSLNNLSQILSSAEDQSIFFISDDSNYSDIHKPILTLTSNHN